MMLRDNDTIAAIATAPGQGSIGIVRVSGELAPVIAHRLCGRLPLPGRAVHASFTDVQGQVVDDGIVIYHRAPRSFTGEHVVELQGHGGLRAPYLVLDEVLRLGARRARPGEFSERAFLNGKMDLAQAEGIADLIASTTTQAARAALNSLAGVFSTAVHKLADAMMELRCFLEATLDFADEDIDFISREEVLRRLESLDVDLAALVAGSDQGLLLRDGLTVVLCGPPNAGKSSLLNALAGREEAIVSPTPGTTRDIVRATMDLDGLVLRFADTAGLRTTCATVEGLGIRKARDEAVRADLVLLVLEDDDGREPCAWLREQLGEDIDKRRVLVLRNKVDLSGAKAGRCPVDAGVVRVSALTGAGLADLRTGIKECAGYRENTEGQFTARRRHVEALSEAQRILRRGMDAFAVEGASELLAEDLREAHEQLGLIVGTVTNDELLGSIFATFCIGK